MTLEINGYYQNWAIFWGHYVQRQTPLPTLTPKTWTPIANGLDWISYGFATVKKNSDTDYSVVDMYPTKTGVPSGGSDPEVFADLNDKTSGLKSKNPNLKTLLAVGGWTFNDPGAATETYFSDIMNNEQAIDSFITSATQFVKTNGFDGLEIDWEYAGFPSRGGKEIDFYNFEQFVKKFKTQNPDMILAMDCGPFLSAEIAQQKWTALSGYKEAGITVPMITDDDYYNWLARLGVAKLDHLQVMAYDYNAAAKSGGTTLPNAPLKTPAPSTHSCPGKDRPLPRRYQLVKQLDKFQKSDQKCATTNVNGPACDASSLSDAPICQVTVHGIGKTVEDLLYTYNNLDSTGQPDLASFNKNNPGKTYALTDTLPTSGTYKVCGVQYTVLAGDGYYDICKNKFDVEDSPGGQALHEFCGTFATDFAGYNNNSQLQPGNVLSMPIPCKQAATGMSNCKETCSGPTPPPPGSAKTVENTTTGLIKAFKAANLNPADFIFMGLAFYGRTYCGVDFPANVSPADAIKSGKTYSSWCPGGYYSGNCGQDSCGTLTYREISQLLTADGLQPCKTTSPSTNCEPVSQWKKLTGDPNTPGEGVFDPDNGTAVAYDLTNKVWVTYDNAESLKAKIDWLKTQGIKGVMLFGPADDDDKFTLTNTVFNEVKPDRDNNTPSDPMC